MSDDKRCAMEGASGPERFVSLILALVEPFGINTIPEIYSYVILLVEAVERHVFEKNHGSAERRTHQDRKRFIAMFRGLYLQLTDLEYTRAVTPVEAKLVSQANKTLREQGFETAEYLTWMFGEFLPENPKFSPPTLRQVCGNFFVHKFIVGHREQSKDNMRRQVDEKAVVDLIKRSRILLRSELLDGEREKVREQLGKVSEQCIILTEFRQVVETVEAALRQRQA